MTTVRTRVSWTVALTLAAWLLVVPGASAYVDPGSGSFVFQALIAFFMAAGLSAKMFWRRIKGFFTKRTAHHKPR